MNCLKSLKNPRKPTWTALSPLTCTLPTAYRWRSPAIIAQEQVLDVDTQGFQEAMEAHRLASGAGKEFGNMGGDDVEIYTQLVEALTESAKLNAEGVQYNPYQAMTEPVEVLALVGNGQPIKTASPGEKVEVLLPKTGFYIESGGQVSDTGKIVSADGEDWTIQITGMRKPAAGRNCAYRRSNKGFPQRLGTWLWWKLMLNAARQSCATTPPPTCCTPLCMRSSVTIARQAGSLVAPDRLRFDFNHPQSMTREELLDVEARVNKAILANYPLHIVEKSLQEAIDEGAMALFGEKYGEAECARSPSVKKCPIPTNCAAVPMWMRQVISACSSSPMRAASPPEFAG